MKCWLLALWVLTLIISRLATCTRVVLCSSLVCQAWNSERKRQVHSVAITEFPHGVLSFLKYVFLYAKLQLSGAHWLTERAGTQQWLISGWPLVLLSLHVMIMRSQPPNWSYLVIRYCHRFYVVWEGWYQYSSKWMTETVWQVFLTARFLMQGPRNRCLLCKKPNRRWCDGRSAAFVLTTQRGC